jgi:hypothetical protein
MWSVGESAGNSEIGCYSVVDYVAWQKTNGLGVTAGTGADGNVDGAVDSLDFSTWQTHFGNAVLAGFGEQQSMWAGGGASVPEPGDIRLLGFMAVHAVIVCKRHRQSIRILAAINGQK